MNLKRRLLSFVSAQFCFSFYTGLLTFDHLVSPETGSSFATRRRKADRRRPFVCMRGGWCPRSSARGIYVLMEPKRSVSSETERLFICHAEEKVGQTPPFRLLARQLFPSGQERSIPLPPSFQNHRRRLHRLLGSCSRRGDHGSLLGAGVMDKSDPWTPARANRAQDR
jgi:hypothetical protein